MTDTNTFRNPITGLIQVTGENDVGKTVFALSSGTVPDRMAFFDDDIKGRSTVEQLRAGGFQFGLYIDLVKEFENRREIDIHEHVLDLIQRITPDRYDVLVWDTWTRFQSTFGAVVQKNPTRFREFYAPKGDIKAGEMWNEAIRYEAQVIGDLLRRVPLVILITHLKDENLNGKKTGRQIPDSKKTLTQKSNFRVWLRHNPDGPAPIGLILKRPVKLVVTPQGIQPINVLPRKMKPCTWERIWHYWENPVGDRPLTVEEKPDEFELSILDGVLTRDQKDVLRLAVLEAEKEAAESAPIVIASNVVEAPPAWAADAKRWFGGKDLLEGEEKLTLPGIAVKVREQFGMEVSVAEVVKWTR